MKKTKSNTDLSTFVRTMMRVMSSSMQLALKRISVALRNSTMMLLVLDLHRLTSFRRSHKVEDEDHWIEHCKKNVLRFHLVNINFENVRRTQQHRFNELSLHVTMRI